MISKEKYEKELARMLDYVKDKTVSEKIKSKYGLDKGTTICSPINCHDCPFYGVCGYINTPYDVIEIVEKWSKEHPEPHRISKLEHDILAVALKEHERKIAKNEINSSYEFTFNFDNVIYELLRFGYFAGATETTSVKKYLENCEVVEQ